MVLTLINTIRSKFLKKNSCREITTDITKNNRVKKTVLVSCHYQLPLFDNHPSIRFYTVLIWVYCTCYPWYFICYFILFMSINSLMKTCKKLGEGQYGEIFGAQNEDGQAIALKVSVLIQFIFKLSTLFRINFSTNVFLSVLRFVYSICIFFFWAGPPFNHSPHNPHYSQCPQKVLCL